MRYLCGGAILFMASLSIARSFCSSSTANFSENETQQVSTLQNASDFFSHRGQTNGRVSREEFLAYLLNEVFSDPDFREDPRDFVLGLQAQEIFSHFGVRSVVIEFLRDELDRNPVLFVERVKIEVTVGKFGWKSHSSAIKTARRKLLMSRIRDHLKSSGFQMAPLQIDFAVEVLEQRVLPDQEFIYAPRAYLDRWQESLSEMTNNYIADAESHVCSILQSLDDQDLIRFIEVVQSAHFSFPPGQRPLSSSWKSSVYEAELQTQK